MSETSENNIKRYTRRSDLRDLPPAAQAVRIVDETGKKIVEVIKPLGVSRSAYKRARRAMNQNRDVSKGGRPPILNLQQETELLRQIERSARQNKTLSSVEVRRKAAQILATSRDEESDANSVHAFPGLLSKNWYHSFQKRRKEELNIPNPKPLERERHPLRAGEVADFYAQFQQLIEEYDIPKELLANMEETAIEFHHKDVKFVDQTQVFTPQDDRHLHVTLIPCVFADGSSLKPLATVQANNIPSGLDMQDIVEYDWRYQDKGWMTERIWSEWISDVFLPTIEERRRLRSYKDRYAMLVVNGHYSRLSPDALRACQKARVIVKTYVAHSSHWSQVLDCGVFMELEDRTLQFLPTKSFHSDATWRDEAIKASVLAMSLALRPGIVIDAWKNSGCWPVDVTKVVNTEHFPTLNLPSPDNSPPKKRKRNGFTISNRTLTLDTVIEEIQKEKCSKSSK